MARNPKTDKEIIDQCAKDMAEWFSYFSLNNQKFRVNRKFAAGNQWDDQVSQEYVSNGKPTLVIDQTIVPIKKMLGAQKTSKVEPLLIPADDSETPENIDILTGLLRRINYDNHAIENYSICFDNMLIGGWGVLKLKTDYANNKTFDQEIFLESEEDPTNTFFDPIAVKSTKSDGRFWGSFQIMSKDEFESTYPDSKIPATSILPSNTFPLLIHPEQKVILIEYFLKSFVDKTLIELSNGIDFKREVFKEDQEKTEQEYFAQMEAQNVPLLNIAPLTQTNKRKTTLTKITCYKLTSEEILETYDWDSEFAPKIFVDCDSSLIDGRQITRSFLEVAKDAQIFYNYIISDIAYSLKIAHREKFMMTPKQLNGFKDLYVYPEKVKGALLFNPDPEVPGYPKDIPPQEVSQSLFLAATQASNDILKTLGMLDPVTGELPNVMSGVAMKRTIQDRNLVVRNALENLFNGIEYIAQATLDLIPKIYDSDRIISITNEDKQTNRVHINTLDQQGNPKNDIQSLSEAVKEVQIKVESSFEEQEETTIEILMQLMQNPAVFPLIADLLPDVLPLPLAPKLKERLQYLVPPYVLNKQPAPPPQPDPETMLKQGELKLKQMELMQDSQNVQQKNMVDQEKNELEKVKTILEQIRTQINSDTEIKKAQMDMTGELIKGLAEVKKAQNLMNFGRSGRKTDRYSGQP